MRRVGNLAGTESVQVRVRIPHSIADAMREVPPHLRGAVLAALAEGVSSGDTRDLISAICDRNEVQKEFTSEIHRIGVNLNQIAYRLNSLEGVDWEDIRQAMEELLQCIQRFAS